MADTRSGLDEQGRSLSYTGAVALWQKANPGVDLEAAAAEAGVSVEQYLVNNSFLSPNFQGAASEQSWVGPGGNPDPNANIVPITNPDATATYDDNGSGDYIPGGTGGQNGDSCLNDAGCQAGYVCVSVGGKGVCSNSQRVQGDPGTNGGALPPSATDVAPAETTPAPAAAPSGTGTGGDTTYTDGGSGGGSSRRRSGGGSSGGSSGGGGGGGTSTGMAAPAFGSSPNSYPTLPMTPIRRQTLTNLSAVFPNAGRFRTPPGGWREDMAPMFTTGAFGGIGTGEGQTPPMEQAAPAAGGNPFMTGGGIPGGPPAQAAPAAPPAFPSFPSPEALPPDVVMGLIPGAAPAAAPPSNGMMPAFDRPGMASPASPAMQIPGYLPGTGIGMTGAAQQGGLSNAPLPPSLRQRFGL